MGPITVEDGDCVVTRRRAGERFRRCEVVRLGKIEWAKERVLRVLDEKLGDVYPYEVRQRLAIYAVGRGAGLTRKALTRSALVWLCDAGHLDGGVIGWKITSLRA